MSADLHKIKIQQSQQSVVRLLSEIVEANTALDVQSSSTLSLLDTLIDCKKLLPAGTRVVVISDFSDFDPICSTTLRALARQRQVQLVKVSDSLEDSMSVKGILGISNGVSIKRLTMSDLPRSRYLQNRKSQHAELLDCAAQCQSPLLCLTEQDSPDQVTGLTDYGFA